MVSYNRVRTAEAQPIGTAVPWAGPLTEIPPGWLICAGQELEADEYPLLRRILKNTYGGNSGGDFPNYTGTFQVPQPNQKTLADIAIDYFTNDTTTFGADQPTLGIDTLSGDGDPDYPRPAAASIMAGFIGTEGDLGTPGTNFYLTDLNFDFVPDPDGTILKVEIDPSSTAANAATPVLYTDVPAQYQVGDPLPSNGVDALFNVIQNTDNTYTVTIKSKGEGYEEGDLLRIPGNLVGGVDSVNDVFLTVIKVGSPFFSGQITEDGEGAALEFIPGFGVETVNIVGRKLGRNHLPAHLHPGSYETLNIGDNTDRPGRGVCVWDNPEILVLEFWYGLEDLDGGFLGAVTLNCQRVFEGNDELESGNIWGNSQADGDINTVLNPWTTGVGRYSLGSISGSEPARQHVPFETAASGHGIAKTGFTAADGAKKLRARNGQTNLDNADLQYLFQNGYFRTTTLIPFSDQGTQINSVNFDLVSDDPITTGTNVMFNNAAVNFTQIDPATTTVTDVITKHDHQGEIIITYNNGSLYIDSQIQTNTVQANVIPDNFPSALQLIINATSPSLSCLTLIRAY